MLALLLMAPTLLQSAPGERLLMAFSLFGIFFFLITRSPKVGLSLLLVYLGLLGGVRRWLIPDFGWTGYDPLILVMPALAVIPFLGLCLQRRVPRDTPIARLIFWLLVLMCLEVFNPLQGGLVVGVAGAMFYIVPLIWYYVGRTTGTLSILGHLLRLTVLVSIAGAVYGLKQNFLGLSDSETQWLHLSGYSQMVSATVSRSFSFFTSAGEYVGVLSVAITLLWALFLRGQKVALVPIPLLAVALFLGTERTAIVDTLLGCCVVWAVQGKTYRSWIPRSALAVVLAVVGLVWGMQEVQKAQFDPNTALLVQHQTAGLLDPGHSTAGGHFSMVGNGIVSSLSRPLGVGLGATTLAAGKFGGTLAGSEMDFSDMFIALGLVGGVLFLCLTYVVMRTCLQQWQQHRHPVTLAVIGLLANCTAHWLAGGCYMLVTLLWFAVGTVDRVQRSQALPMPASERSTRGRKPAQ